MTYKHLISLGKLRTCLAAAAGMALLAAPSSAGATVGTPLYPDLRMAAPSALHLVQWPLGGDPTLHYQIRFNTKPTNAGEGALEIDRTPTSSGIADLTQRIYESPAGFQDVKLGAVPFDPLDFTFPIPEFARYEVWSKRGFLRAQARHFSRGQPLYVHDSVKHCINDGEAMDPNAVNIVGEGGLPYIRCTKLVSGISVGWRDVETWDNDEQYVDFGTAAALPDGDYVLRVVGDPQNIILESPGKADPARESEIANSAVSYFSVIGGQLAGIETL